MTMMKNRHVLFVLNTLSLLTMAVGSTIVDASSPAKSYIVTRRSLIDTDAPLTELYDIPEPRVYYCDTSASFVMVYDINDYIAESMVQYKMYAKDENGFMSIDISDNPYLKPGLIFDDTPRGDGSGTREVACTMDADGDLIMSSPIYTDRGEKDPYLNFSTKFQLVNEHTGEAVNWFEVEFYFYIQLENVSFENENNVRRRKRFLSSQEDAFQTSTIKEIEFRNSGKELLVGGEEDANPGQLQHHRSLLDCHDGFEIVLQTTTDAPTFSPQPTSPTSSPAPSQEGNVIIQPPHSIAFNFSNSGSSGYEGIEAYLCDENLESIEPTVDPFQNGSGDSLVVLTQGKATIRVCVERSERAIQDGIYIRYIDAFSFFKAGESTIRQVAIAPINQVANNGLTTVHCERGSTKCYFETLMKADFHATSGTVLGAGRATLQFGSSISGRQLQDSTGDEDRQLQEPGDLEEQISLSFAFLSPEDMELLQARDAHPSIDYYEEESSSRMAFYMTLTPLLILLVIMTVLRRNLKRKLEKHLGQENRIALWLSPTCSEDEGDHLKKKNCNVSSRSYSRRTVMSVNDDSSDEKEDEDTHEKSHNGILSPRSSHSRRTVYNDSTRSSRSRRSNRSRRSSSNHKTSRWLDEGDSDIDSDPDNDKKLLNLSKNDSSRRSRRDIKKQSSSHEGRWIYDEDGEKEENGPDKSSHSKRSRRSGRSSSRGRRWLFDDEDGSVNKSSSKQDEREKSSHSKRSRRSGRSSSRGRRWLFDDEDGGVNKSSSKQDEREKSSHSKRSRRSGRSSSRGRRWLFDEEEGDIENSPSNHRKRRSDHINNKAEFFEDEFEETDRHSSRHGRTKTRSSHSRRNKGSGQGRKIDVRSYYDEENPEKQSSNRSKRSSRRCVGE